MSTTAYRGHATEIAEKLDISAYDIVVCSSGDGLPHEIFNGLAKRSDARKALAKIAVVQVPGGSGNAMSCNLNGNHSSASMAALAIVKGVRTRLDLMSVTQGKESTRMLSYLTQAVGTPAEIDLGTENLRWMGSVRFVVGYLSRVMMQKVYPCDVWVKVAIKDRDEIREHYRREVGKAHLASDVGDENREVDDEEGLPPLRYGTISDEVPADWEKISNDKMGLFYCGNMAYISVDYSQFPTSLPNDGIMDLMMADGDIGRFAALRMMRAVETGDILDSPHAKYWKVLAYRVVPRNQKTGYISIDGESVPFEPFQVETHKGLGTVLSKSEGIYHDAPVLK